MATVEECAREVLETIPLLMCTIRSEVRQQRKPDLTVPQFRTLAFLYHQPGAMLSQVAEHVGLTLPSMSKTIDGLVFRGLVARQNSPEDRRRAVLTLAPPGKTIFLAAREAARARLAVRLEKLSHSDQGVVAKAMRALRGVFSAAGDEEARPSRP